MRPFSGDRCLHQSRFSVVARLSGSYQGPRRTPARALADWPRLTSYRRPIRVLPLSPEVPIIRRERRSGSDASRKVSVPFSVRWPCRAVRCSRHPDDPASALRLFVRLCDCAAGTHRDGTFRRPLALAVFRSLADLQILGRSSLAMARLYWIICVSALLATGHASPGNMNVHLSGDVPLPVPASPSRPGRARGSMVQRHLTPHRFRHPATLLGSCPSQCCSCP